MAPLSLSVLSRLLNPINLTREKMMEQSRTRAWRLSQKQRNQSRDVHTALLRFRGEKQWKMLYLRSCKLARAAQLGMTYPRITNKQLAREGLEEYSLVNECPVYLQP